MYFETGSSPIGFIETGYQESRVNLSAYLVVQSVAKFQRVIRAIYIEPFLLRDACYVGMGGRILPG